MDQQSGSGGKRCPLRHFSPLQNMALGDLTFLFPLVFAPTSNDNWDPQGVSQALLRPGPILHSQAKQRTNGNNTIQFSTLKLQMLLFSSWLGWEKENRKRKDGENNVWRLRRSTKEGKNVRIVRGRLAESTGVQRWHLGNTTLCRHSKVPKTLWKVSFHSESRIYM